MELNGYTFTKLQLKNKWKKLRETYNEYSRKLSKSGEGSSGALSWTYFEQMHNLLSTRPRQVTTTSGGIDSIQLNEVEDIPSTSGTGFVDVAINPSGENTTTDIFLPEELSMDHNYIILEAVGGMLMYEPKVSFQNIQNIIYPAEEQQEAGPSNEAEVQQEPGSASQAGTHDSSIETEAQEDLLISGESGRSQRRHKKRALEEDGWGKILKSMEDEGDKDRKLVEKENDKIIKPMEDQNNKLIEALLQRKNDSE
uniref:uncharacterized protein LOC108950952 isoform X2 n=1 Tax=Ciona intestinalis TaxID=7719 RepID=UPI00089DAFEC|nr:uncharacterized protein LOC108950952 isoform X2 [Ciona intestinalis]|eukprot:XP_018672799.1 uncharacterized protein LOC108950952 isoform X2 [Ciona intestinalis]